MEAQDEVLQSLKLLAKQFKSFTFRYYIDQVDGEHIIEVEPADFELKGDFIDHEISILENIYSKFPSESISFLKSSEVLFREDLKLITTLNLPTWIGMIRLYDNVVIENYTPVCDQFNQAA